MVMLDGQSGFCIGKRVRMGDHNPVGQHMRVPVQD